MAQVRVRAYIDGLNLFYGSLKGKPNLKRLDVVQLVESLTDRRPSGSPTCSARRSSSWRIGREV